MGGKPSVIEEAPSSPKSPRVAPVASGDETPVPALLKKMIADTLEELRKNSDDTKQRNTINAIEAIVDNRSRRTEKTITALEIELAEMRKTQHEIVVMLQTLLDQQQS